MSRRPHIVLLVGSLDVGGTETQLVLLAQSLAQRDFKVTVWTLCDEGPLRPILENHGISTFYPDIPIKGSFQFNHLFTTNFLSNLWRLFRFLRKEAPDIVHTFNPENNTLGGLIAELAGVKVRIASRRNRNHYRRQRPLFTHFEDWINRRSTLILGNSRAVLNDLINEGIDPKRLGVIYNGVEADRFNRLDRHISRLDFGLESHELCLAIVANLHPRKRHIDLLEALVHIKTSLPKQWILFIVGRDDGTEGKLRSLASEKDLEANVKFFGPRDDVAKILAASDIGILSSETEGFANAILEYMAAGLPVVATDVGGNAEAITEQVGFVVPKGDTKAMANAILKLALDRNLRLQMGRLGRLRAMKTFSVASMVQEHQKVYLGLLSPK